MKYSKAARRRNKKAMPQLADVPRRERSGCFVERTRQIQDDPQGTVLKARKRRMGHTGPARDMNIAALSEAAGMAIHAVHGDRKDKDGKPVAKTLWDAYRGLTAAEERYHKIVLGQRIHAKTAKIEMMPERFEARDDDNPDLRSEDEKHRDAVNNWMRWRGYVMHLPSYQQVRIFDVVYGRYDPMDGGKVTSNGRKFVEAVEALADVVARK